ncbi:GIY-YIG nuclease family protein [Alkalicoccobacillus porphyridii]|uniref:GIY-YIG nuclease family protein n=1 Tax=Alkalicoccobacillus porphyridii TaxID=2597270 RepID=A0A553ZUI9_9BACI|nr:GIY-YIG nuclease family protein [Alkalicoccobacillus porphyridii]TSB45083.1 GIY-YIG nuclease family protein [Alkalicoccobacillus porphyridii]
MSERHYVYIIECSDHTWYTGYTNNLLRRIEKHNEGKGAKYTRGRGPVTLVWEESFESKTEAMKLEYALKKMPRAKKEEYVHERRATVYATAKKLSD